MIEDEEPFRDPSVRRRRRLLFRERKVPVRLLVPNFFTLLSLCAGVTAIRMAIEGRYELAIGLIVAAVLLLLDIVVAGSRSLPGWQIVLAAGIVLLLGLLAGLTGVTARWPATRSWRPGRPARRAGFASRATRRWPRSAVVVSLPATSR